MKALEMMAKLYVAAVWLMMAILAAGVGLLTWPLWLGDSKKGWKA